MKFLLTHQETPRLRLRPVSRNDFGQWVDFFADPESFKYWDAVRSDPVSDCENWYARQLERYRNNEGGMNAIIEKSTDELVGHGGLLIQQVDGISELEVAYSLLSRHRNKGFATEVARKCRDFAFENDFAPSLISIISHNNSPSSRVAEKNNMAVDKYTIYHENDVNIYRIYREDWIARELNSNSR
ncbi:MAG: GNAT family N-acetyltransferase [Chryseolinea sp.]